MATLIILFPFHHPSFEQVTGIYDCAKSAPDHGKGDAQALIKELRTKLCFWRAEYDDSGRLVCILWATVEQINAAIDWADVICQDNTFCTNKYGLKLCVFVIVDGNNRCGVFAALHVSFMNNFCRHLQ